MTDLEYHREALRVDVRAAAAAVDGWRQRSVSERVRALADVMTLLEHAIGYHALHAGGWEDSREVSPWPWVPAPGALPLGDDELLELLRHLIEQTTDVSPGAWPEVSHALRREVEAVWPRLGAMAQRYGTRQEESSGQVGWPDEPTQRAIRGARSLTVCPECGAALSAEDRTFDGVLCEVCNVVWVDEADRTS